MVDFVYIYVSIITNLVSYFFIYRPISLICINIFLHLFKKCYLYDFSLLSILCIICDYHMYHYESTHVFIFKGRPLQLFQCTGYTLTHYIIDICVV